MKDNLTSADIANTVSMLRSSHKGPVMVVEGITDCRLYSKFTDPDHVKVVSAFSKDNVKKAVMEVWSGRNDKKVLGIMDADIDRLCNKVCNPPLFYADKRDQETMIMSSRALEDVLTEYSDPELLHDFEENHGPVRDAIVKATYPIGLLMFISSRERLGLNFKNIDHSFFVSNKTLAIDIRKMIDEIFSQSMNSNISKKELIDMISEEEEVLDDPWIAVRGHDAISVLEIGLNHIFGAYNSRGIKSGQLSGSMRLAYGTDYFFDTDLYRDTMKWSERYNLTLWVTQ